MFTLELFRLAKAHERAVPGLKMITPDNTTTIDDYVNNYKVVCIGSSYVA